MTFKKRHDIGNWKRKYLFVHRGELALEEVMDLSQDRLLKCMNGSSCTTLAGDISGVYIGTLHQWGFLKIYRFTWNRLWNKGKNKGILNIMKAFWTLELNGSARSASYPDCLTTGERTSCTHWITGWPQSWSGCSERRKDLVLQFLACLDLKSLVTVLARLLIYMEK